MVPYDTGNTIKAFVKLDFLVYCQISPSVSAGEALDPAAEFPNSSVIMVPLETLGMTANTAKRLAFS